MSNLPRPHTSGSMLLKPYLQLGDRISQIWLNQCTLMLVLTTIKLILFAISMKNAIETSKRNSLSSCDSLDYFYIQLMNSAPKYMCQFGNYLIEQSVKESVKASLKLASMLVYAGEKLSTFLFDFYFGTYVCLATSAVDGAVDVATNTTEKVLDLVNGTVISFSDELNNGLGDLSKLVNNVVDALQHVEHFFQGDDDTSDVNSTFSAVNLTISKLRDMHIPSSIDAKLNELSQKTPDFDTVMNKTHSKITQPFELVRTKIAALNVTRLSERNDTLYLPAPNSSYSSVGICSSSKPEMLKFYAGVSRTIDVAVVILATVLAVTAVCAMIPSYLEERRQWNRLMDLQKGYENAQLQYSYPKRPDSHPDILETFQRVYNKWPTAIGKRLSTWTTKSIRTKRKIQWCVAYAMSPRALTVLGVSLAGIGMCVCQFILIAALHRVATGKSVQRLATATLTSANSSLQNDMAQWASSTNRYINSTSAALNQELFGWVQSTTSSLNSTVHSAIEDIDTVLADFFNGTLLYKPMASVVHCTIGNKLSKIQDALIWVHDKSHISLPLIDGPLLSAALKGQTSGQNSTDLSNSTQEMARKLSQTTQSAVLAIIDQYRAATLIELVISLVLLALWLLQWLIALTIVNLIR